MLLSVRLDQDLFSRIELLSNTTKRPKSFYIKEAIREYLENFDALKYEPNKETLKAIKESDDIIKNPQKYKGYHDVDQMFKDILND